mgnify:CR=1 FL=1
MPSIVIRLDPGKLANPDADLRYEIPDLLAARSDGALADDGYDYEADGDAMQIYLRITTAEVDHAVAMVIAFLETETLHDNDLSVAATVGVSESPGPVVSTFEIVYPRGVAGTIEIPTHA